MVYCRDRLMTLSPKRAEIGIETTDENPSVAAKAV